MAKKHIVVFTFILNIFILSICGIAGASPIVVNTVGEDILIKEKGEFELLFDKSRGGTISKYFDLKTDPRKKTNIAVNHSQGSLYNGLYFIMFKQGGGHNNPIPERWTALFQTRANMKVTYQDSTQVVVQVTGKFLSGGMGLPASYNITYSIESNPNTSGALIYIRSKIIFDKNYSNTMQIRQALCLTGRYGTSGGWVEYSQRGVLRPYWTYRAGDDYIGARLNASLLKTDPVLILHRDWRIADYILLIAPPKAPNYCLIAWVSNRLHKYTAGHVIENKYLLRMDQRNVTANNSVERLAAAYRKTDGGDFEGSTNANVGGFLPLLLDEK